MRAHLAALALVLFWVPTAHADPCGMVPPIWDGPGPAITRVGPQITYAAFKDGVETFVIRPGFSGKVDNFGMLIPFPSPPAIRKVADELFDHLAAAIDPPEVILDLRPPEYEFDDMIAESAAAPSEGAGDLTYDSVRVIKQEAVGMYEVTVLEAGSAAALKRWMDQHGYVYPQGMDGPVTDYVRLRWPFVAVKTRVGSGPQVQPRPGIDEVTPTLPPGSSFDGAVQGMGFRFRVATPVIPMRLSAFNEGRLRNIIYFLGPQPARVVGLSESLVMRQIPGTDLMRNVTEPLPVRILGGTLDDVTRAQFDGLRGQRNPAPHNAKARELFASDLLAIARGGEMSLPFEEKEKTLLRIGEALLLRGPNIDQLNDEALDAERKQTLGRALGGLDRLHLTVIDGDLPREHLASTNLTFAAYHMPKKRNTPVAYDAKNKGPGYDAGGELVRGDPFAKGDRRRWWQFWK